MSDGKKTLYLEPVDGNEDVCFVRAINHGKEERPEKPKRFKVDGVNLTAVKPEPKRGVAFQLMMNKKTGEQWYDEVTRNLTDKERMDVIEEKLDAIIALLQA